MFGMSAMTVLAAIQLFSEQSGSKESKVAGDTMYVKFYCATESDSVDVKLALNDRKTTPVTVHCIEEFCHCDSLMKFPLEAESTTAT